MDAVQEQHEEEYATIQLPNNRTIKLPFRKDQSGAEFIDIRTLRSSTGVCTFDPGYFSTGSCESSITFIDGGKGILLYRGYDVADLADQGDFVDATHLLLLGELPSAAEKTAFAREITRHTMVHEQLIQFYKGFLHGAHPMALMVGVVGALAAFYPGAANVRDAQERLSACIRLIAKMPTLAAIAYKTSIGQPLVYPRNDLSYAANFLHMMFAVPTERYEVDPVLERAMEVILILHMDHEQNASTSTVRTAGSSQANPFACIASGISCLWGPQHGGANEAVLRMLEEIGSPDNIPSALARAKDKGDAFRLMGFGHRVYKNYDPRAKIMRSVCHDVLDHLDIKNDALLDVAVRLEEEALKDEYFLKRNLFPNVDFYSGIVLRAMGIPVSMFTVLFAVARTVGWVAQWKEMSEEPVTRISRPRQAYHGHMHRLFPTVEQRSGSKGGYDPVSDDAAAGGGANPRRSQGQSRNLSRMVSVKCGVQR
ncbi:hypothetical protein WJX73_000854 [Symbiochloris irregularis]|uniref:Citrate synthase n=1 Tax=Symbiochloris irregularis TaxID=706552 RepID=A0AAW1P624_9CHLO